MWNSGESFRADSTFKTYMYGIAKNILKIYLRQLYKNAEILKIVEVSYMKSELSEPEAAYSYVELCKEIEINKSKLPKKI